MMEKQVAVGASALLMAIIGATFVGGALWLGQGDELGTGDVVGIGMLLSLGIGFVLFGLGTGLASVVTYLVHQPALEQAQEEAVAPKEPEAPRPAKRPWLSFWRRATS